MLVESVTLTTVRHDIRANQTQLPRDSAVLHLLSHHSSTREKALLLSLQEGSVTRENAGLVVLHLAVNKHRDDHIQHHFDSRRVGFLHEPVLFLARCALLVLTERHPVHHAKETQKRQEVVIAVQGDGVCDDGFLHEGEGQGSNHLQLWREGTVEAERRGRQQPGIQLVLDHGLIVGFEEGLTQQGELRGVPGRETR